MLSTDKRVVAVKQRTKKLKHDQKIRSNRIISFASITASLVAIVGIGVFMPGIIAQMGIVENLSVGIMGSIFSGVKAVGYVIIGLLAFIFGVCVTILSVHLHYRSKEMALNDGEGDGFND